MKLIPFLFAIFVSTFSFGQDLVLSNGNKRKTFKTGTFVAVTIPSKVIEPCEACEGNFTVGKVVSYTNDLLTLDAIRSGHIVVEEGKQIAYSDTRYTFKSGNNRIVIPSHEILSVTKQGKKKYKQTSTGQAIGYTAILLSLGHLISLPFADEDRDVLAVVGLTELGLGIIMASTLGAKRYVTSINCPSAPRIPDQIWQLK